MFKSRFISLLHIPLHCSLICYNFFLIVFFNAFLFLYYLTASKAYATENTEDGAKQRIYLKRFLLGTEVTFSSAKSKTFYEDYLCMTSTEINPGCDIKEQDEA